MASATSFESGTFPAGSGEHSDLPGLSCPGVLTSAALTTLMRTLDDPTSLARQVAKVIIADFDAAYMLSPRGIIRAESDPMQTMLPLRCASMGLSAALIAFSVPQKVTSTTR